MRLALRLSASSQRYHLVVGKVQWTAMLESSRNLFEGLLTSASSSLPAFS